MFIFLKCIFVAYWWNWLILWIINSVLDEFILHHFSIMLMHIMSVQNTNTLMHFCVSLNPYYISVKFTVYVSKVHVCGIFMKPVDFVNVWFKCFGWNYLRIYFGTLFKCINACNVWLYILIYLNYSSFIFRLNLLFMFFLYSVI